MKKAIGVDIGGTKSAIGIVGDDGTLERKTSLPTVPESGFARAAERRSSHSGRSLEARRREEDVLPTVTREDYEALSRTAAGMVARTLAKKPGALLCVAAGQTPVRTYELLAEHRRSGSVSFDEVRVIKLDEWHGLAMSNPATCEVYVRANVLEPLQVDEARYCGFRSDCEDGARECERVARWLETNGPIDVMVLGLGVNGHLGLNEPGPGSPHAHLSRLAKESRSHSMLRDTRTEVTHGLTLGLKDIMTARKVLLLVSGEHKAAPYGRLMAERDPIAFPATVLHEHPDAICICDRACAG